MVLKRSNSSSDLTSVCRCIATVHRISCSVVVGEQADHDNGMRPMQPRWQSHHLKSTGVMQEWCVGESTRSDRRSDYNEVQRT